MTTEPVMANLFSLALTLKTSSTPFNIMSRRFRHFKDVSPEDIPAFFQYQAPGRSAEGGVRSLTARKFKAYWVVYLPGSPDLDTTVSPLMNSYYDALSNLLVAPLAGQKQTLGGLVTNCYEDGQGFFDEGLLDTPSLIILPITILTGF